MSDQPPPAPPVPLWQRIIAALLNRATTPVGDTLKKESGERVE